jgi:hypothetical protein
MSTLPAPTTVPTYHLQWSTVKIFSEVKVADLYQFWGAEYEYDKIVNWL